MMRLLVEAGLVVVGLVVGFVVGRRTATRGLPFGPGYRVSGGRKTIAQ